MKIRLVSISISEKDYDRAIEFYCTILGFIKKMDVAFGSARLITLVSPEDPEGPEIVLEPNAEYPAMGALRDSLKKDGIAHAAFLVADVQEEYERLQKLGVKFTMEPTDMGIETSAIFDDTLGNLIMIYSRPMARRSSRVAE